MAENQQPKEKKQKPPRPPGVWGITDLQALEAFQAKTLEVHMANGDVLTGDLVGYGSYSLTLKVDDQVIVVGKGAIAWYGLADVGSRE